MITWKQDLELKPGSRWMLLTNNGKLIMEPGEIPGRWKARFLFASKSDMIRDIQTGLRAKRCAGRMNWTIEQHSILVARIMAIFWPEEEWGPLKGLFHDAHEAYISDVPSPVGATLESLDYSKGVLDDGIYDFLDFDFKEPERRKVHIADKIAWDLESAGMLDFDPNDPFILKHCPALSARRLLGINGMVKGYAPQLETVIRELLDGKHTFESEFRRLTSLNDWLTRALVAIESDKKST